MTAGVVAKRKLNLAQAEVLSGGHKERQETWSGRGDRVEGWRRVKVEAQSSVAVAVVACTIEGVRGDVVHLQCSIPSGRWTYLRLCISRCLPQHAGHMQSIIAQQLSERVFNSVRISAASKEMYMTSPSQPCSCVHAQQTNLKARLD